MDLSTDPGVTAPPADTTTATTPPPVSEDVTNTGKSDEQTVPFTRFQEVNDKAKTAEERAAQLESELASLKEQQIQTPEDDVEPDTLELIKKANAKLGYVSKEELDAREARIQVQSDINELTSHYKDSGIPFDGKKVIEYAKANGMPLGSKKSLDAVYKEMNFDTIVETQRKAAIAAHQESAKSGAEKSGSSGAKAPSEPKPTSLKDRIRMARENAKVSI